VSCTDVAERAVAAPAGTVKASIAGTIQAILELRSLRALMRVMVRAVRCPRNG
jgi:hypothetical protein